MKGGGEQETGPLFRCARVNGVWRCHKGCARAELAALLAARDELALANSNLYDKLNQLVEQLEAEASMTSISVKARALQSCAKRIASLEAQK